MENKTIQRFILLEDLPLQGSQTGRKVAWEIKNGLQSTPDWGIDMAVIEVDMKELQELQNGKMRYDFNAQRTVRGR